MFVNRCYEKENMSGAAAMPEQANTCMMPGQEMCMPVTECPQERVCHVNTCHTVPHVVPIHTRIINHHIVRHTYQPVYTCSMEDEVCNVYDNPCGF